MVKTAVGKSGWSDEETQMLMGEAKMASEKGMPLKRAFDAISELTGRKPNSIRNYYYLRVREEEHRVGAFIPFSPEQVDALMRRMLTDRAQGKSVRSIANEMAEGDKKEMLRYQNKYRSVLANDEPLVRRVMAQLDEEAIAYVNPYEVVGRRKAKKRDIACVISELAANLSKLDVDTEALLSMLCDVSRASGEKLPEKAHTAGKEEHMLGILTRINKEFIAMSGMERISHLGEYVSSLENIIEC